MATITKTKFNTYRVQIRRSGLPPIYQSFKTKEQALTWVRKTEYELDIGTHLSKEDSERITFAELATRYVNQVSPKKKGHKQEVYRFDFKFFCETNSTHLMLLFYLNYEAKKYLLHPGRFTQQDKAIVYIVRPTQLGGLVRFNVFLDNQEDSSEMGYTRAGQYIYFNLTPGEHKIYSKAENWAESLVTVKPGDVVFLQQEPSMGIIMARDTMFKLDDHEGKYHVKTLTLGTIIKSDK